MGWNYRLWEVLCLVNFTRQKKPTEAPATSSPSVQKMSN